MASNGIALLAQHLFPDNVFREQAKLCTDTLLPKIGEAVAVPTLLVLADNTEDDKAGFEFIFCLIDHDDFGDNSKRFTLLKDMGAMIAEKKHQAVCAFLVTEAWVSRKTQQDIFKMPAQDPNRQEAAIVVGMTIDTRMYQNINSFRRGKDENIAVFDEPNQKFSMDLKPNEKMEMNILNKFWYGYAQEIVNPTIGTVRH